MIKAIMMLMGLCGVLMSNFNPALAQVAAVDSYEEEIIFECLLSECEVEVIEESTRQPATAEAILGDWSLGAGGFVLSVPSGPTAIGGEGTIIGDLKIADDLFFHLSASPGAASVGDRPAFSLAEFAGLQVRVGNSFSFTSGARHRVTFQEGDNCNALLGEIQLRFLFSDSYAVALSGGGGYSWFPEEESVPGLFPAGFEAPTRTVIEGGMTWSAAIGLERRF